MKLSIIVPLAVSLAPVFAIPPENFGFPSAPNDTALSVNYQYNGTGDSVYTNNDGVSYLRVQEGELLGINVPATRPVLAVNLAAYSSLASRPQNEPYLVMMVDPDASYPQTPNRRFILHYLQPNMTYVTDNAQTQTYGGYVLTNSTPAVAEYRRPAPPTNSSAHRYILYAFAQPNNFTIPPAFRGYGGMNITSFNLTQFISAAGLGTPVAAMYYYCSNETAVPATFTASPGATYPGGNGQMVTSGFVAIPSSPSPTGVSTTSGGNAGATSTSASTSTSGGNRASSSGTSTSGGGSASRTTDPMIATSAAAAAGAMKADFTQGTGAMAAFVMAAGVGAAWQLI